jgi:hypothetical protein
MKHVDHIINELEVLLFLSERNAIEIDDSQNEDSVENQNYI